MWEKKGLLWGEENDNNQGNRFAKEKRDHGEVKQQP